MEDYCDDFFKSLEDDEFLKSLQDVDWEEDWDEVLQLCGGSDSLCCVDQAQVTAAAPDHDLPLREEHMESHFLNQPTSSTAMTLRPRRFREVKDDEICCAIEERIPRNTVKSTAWCMRIFSDWCKERAVSVELTAMPASEINKFVTKFVYEVVKQDGSPYPPNSLYQIIVGLQRHLREDGRPEIAFFDDRSPVFDDLRKSLDARMKQLACDGLGMERKSADPISREMEVQLCEKGLFSRETSEGLVNVVYFYNCKLFGLRSGDEHSSLTVEQFKFGISDGSEYVQFTGSEYVQFTGSTSKTYHGGLKHRKLLPKVLKIHSVPELGERDIVCCYKYYLSLILEKGAFYRRPSKASPLVKQPSFTNQVIGKNSLSGLVKKFCSQAGFVGNFTGHSGKVTCATELFINDVDEQLIQVQTGHRSTASVRCYKRPQDDHFKKISKILQPSSSKLFCQSS